MSGEQIEIADFADAELVLTIDAAMTWARTEEPFLLERLDACNTESDHVAYVVTLGRLLDAFLASSSSSYRTPASPPGPSREGGAP